MWRLFRPRKYRGQNKRHGFLKEFIEEEEKLYSLLSLVVLLQGTVAGISDAVLRSLNTRHIIFESPSLYEL